MDDLLSLKWDNHKSSFHQLLSILRMKSNYTDATLACDGKLYNVHKIVLSACSDYFGNIFENISCINPVIVLTDMSTAHLEALLDYMYLGEVNVRQADLDSVIQAATCLKLKGLAVPDDEADGYFENKKRPAEGSCGGVKKKLRKPTPTKCLPLHCDPPLRADISGEPSELYADASELKTEADLDNVVNIKEEADSFITEYTDAWDFKPGTVENTSEHCTSSFSSNISNAGENLEGSFGYSMAFASGSENDGNHTQNSGADGRKPSCSYCNKKFSRLDNLRRHIRIHMEFKPYLCPQCTYRSNRKENLANHIQQHHRKDRSRTGADRIIDCKHCDKKFYDLYDLKRHSRIHTGEKPFSCPHCPHKSNQKSNMDIHITLKHSEVIN